MLISGESQKPRAQTSPLYLFFLELAPEIILSLPHFKFPASDQDLTTPLVLNPIVWIVIGLANLRFSFIMYRTLLCYCYYPYILVQKKLGEMWFHFSISYARGVVAPKLYVDVLAGPRKSDFLYTIFFSAQFPSHQYHFRKKTPNFDQIGCFLQ